MFFKRLNGKCQIKLKDALRRIKCHANKAY